MKVPRARAVVLGGAAAFYLSFIGRAAFTFEGQIGFTLFDDAMISMRYARNLAEGHGLVWNPGDTPVEGFTNPLWTLFMAGVHAAGAADLTAAMWVSLAAALLVVVSALLSSRIAALTGDSAAPLVALCLAALDYGYAFWSLRGMEVPLLGTCTAAMALASLHYVRRPAALPLASISVAAACAMLARRDAAVAALACAAYLAAMTRGRARWSALAAIGATTALVQAGLMGFSVLVFGDPWPNTYYLKLEGVGLATRVARGGPAAALTVLRHLGPLMVVAAVSFVRRENRPLLALAGSIMSGQLAYSVYVGGDAWEHMGYANRYLAPAVPVLCAAAAAGLCTLSRRGMRRTAVAIALLVLARIGADVAATAAGRGVEPFQDAATILLPPAIAGALVLALVAVTFMPARRPGTRPPLVAGVALIWLAANGAAAITWAARNGSHVPQDRRNALVGLTLNTLTAPEARIAVTSAGIVPYFARRPAIDILGKSDPGIARMPPTGEFHPGHNKWDLNRSVRGPRPDLVFGLPRRTGEVRWLMDLGYEPWPGSTFARRDSRRFDRPALREAFERIYPDIPPRRPDE